MRSLLAALFAVLSASLAYGQAASTTTVPGQLLSYPLNLQGVVKFPTNDLVLNNAATNEMGAFNSSGALVPFATCNSGLIATNASGAPNCTQTLTLGTGATQTIGLTSANAAFPNTFEITNTGTSTNSSTVSNIVTQLVCGNCYANYGAVGGSSPLGYLSTGSGMTGGLTLQASAGNLSLSSPAGDVVATSPVIFNGLGTGTATSCLGLTSADSVVSTGCGGGGGTVITCNGSDVGSTINSDLAANTKVILTAGVCDSSIVVNLPNWASLVGAGPEVTTLEFTCTTCNGVSFVNTSDDQGGALRDMTIQAGSARTGSANVSSGIGVYLDNSEYGFDLSNVIVRNFTTGFECYNSYQTSVKNLVVQGWTTGVYLNGGACGLLVNVQSSNNGYSAGNGTAWKIEGDGGSQISNSGGWSGATQWVIGGTSINTQLSNVVGNSSAGTGDCFDIEASDSVSISGGVAASCHGYGLYIGHDNSAAYGFSWTGGSIYGSYYGVYVNGTYAVGCTISGANIVSNGYGQTGAAAVGVYLDGVDSPGHCLIENNVIGQTNGVTQQLYGINYGSSTNVAIIGNDEINNTTASAEGTLSGSANVNANNLCKSGTPGAC